MKHKRGAGFFAPLMDIGDTKKAYMPLRWAERGF